MKTCFLLGLMLLTPVLLAQTTTLSVTFQPPASNVQTGSSDAPVFQFTLTKATAGGPANFTALSFTNAGTAGASDYTQYRLYFVPFTGTPTLLGSSASPATAFSGFAHALPNNVPQAFAISVDVPGGATVGNTFQLSVASAGVTVSNGTVTGGPITGNVHTITAPTGAVMDVRDALSTSIPSGGTSTYDLAAAQGDTPLTGQSYNFTIHNTGTAQLNLTGTPAVSIAGETNCTVTPTQPASIAIAAGGNVGFSLLIDPNTATTFSFSVAILNNSATNPYLFTVTGNGVNTAATQLVITTQPGGGTAGATWAQQPVVEARNAGGTVDTSFTGAVAAAITTGTGNPSGTLLGTVSVNCVAGVANFTNLAIDLAGTGYTLDFSATGLTGTTSGTFNITASTTATQLVVTTQPGGGTGGSAWAQQPVVEARDAGGSVDTAFTGAVLAVISTGTGNPSGTLLGTVSVNCVAGVASFTNLAIDLAGTGYTLDFSATGLTGTTSGTFNITVGSATQLVITTQPGNGTGGSALSAQPVLEVRDAGGNLVSADNSTVVNAAITGGTGTATAQIVAGSTATASAGVVTFAGLAIDLAGTGYTLDFSASGLTGATSATFNVTVGPPAALAIATQPGGASIGVPFTTQPVIHVVDAGGNLVTSDNTTQVTAGISTGTGATGAVLGGLNNPATATGGVVTFTDLEINLAGTGYTLDFDDGSALTDVTSAAFNVAGPPTQLGMVTQPAGAVAGAQFVTQPTVEIQDAAGNRVTSDNTTQVTVSIATGAGAFIGGSTLTVTAVNGLVSFTDLGIDTAGAGFSLQFDDTLAALSNVTSATFSVAGPATQLVIVTQPSGAVAGTAFTSQPVIQIQDASGVLVATDNTTQVTVTITAGTGAAGAVLAGTTTVTAVNGVVTFTNLSINLSGTGYTLDFADSGPTLTGVTSSAFNVTSTPSSSGGGGDGGDDEGCSTGSGIGWMMLLGALALLAVTARARHEA